jgi:hypothetical protein
VASEDQFIIDYAHGRGGQFFQATVIGTPTKFRVIWSVTDASGQRIKDGKLSREQFKFLWNTLVDAEVFQRTFVTDTDRDLDPIAGHVLRVRFQEAGETGADTYYVPVSESDADWKAWLHAIEATYAQSKPRRAELEPESQQVA